MDSSPNRWQPRDAFLGLLLFVFGALVTTYAYLAMRNEVPSWLWVLAWIVGPLLLLIGGNGIVRALAARRERSDQGPADR
jgi:hypothetical protein